MKATDNTIEQSIAYLESRLPKDGDIEATHFNSFKRFCGYKGNGIYEWRGFVSTDTRELFLLGILHREGIKFDKERYNKS